MFGIRSGFAAIAVACVSAMAFAQGSAGDPLGVGRQMLAEDNPASCGSNAEKRSSTRTRSQERIAGEVRFRNRPGKA